MTSEAGAHVSHPRGVADPSVSPDRSAPGPERHWAKWTAAAGCLGALGYGGLKAAWALGVTIGIDHPAQLRPAGTSDGLWLIENLATAALAGIAALILLALILPAGAFVPRWIVRTLGWLGTVMVIPGAVGLAEILDYIGGTHLFHGTNLGGVSAGAYVFVYICFLALGLAFAGTTFLTRESRGLGVAKHSAGTRWAWR